MASWHSANVLQTSAGGRRLWQISTAGGRFAVQSETTLLLNEACPPGVADKDWHTLFRRKLNVAWLPADKVFFRAVQLPSSDPAEITSMVELQLEKLSPLPVTHIVWSIYLWPRQADKPDALQTVLIIIAARSAVEEFLGRLETENFLPDCLEAPGLDQLLATKFNDEGVWLFVGPAGEPAISLWWYGGTIQNLGLVPLSAGPERGAELKVQLEQIAWAGELEGWMNGPIKVHLVAPPAESAFWESVFKGWTEHVQVVPPASPKELAALSAQRCSNGARQTNLLPAEFATRYRQQFVDRLWLRGLMGVTTLYILGVLFYFGMLYVFQLKTDTVKRALTSMQPAYNNSQKDIEQISILKAQQALKYAALDCWKAVAEHLPDSITVDNMFFQRGVLELRGMVIYESKEDVYSFNEALRSAVDANQHEPLFADVTPPQITQSGDKGQWSFHCTLKDSDKQ